MKTRTNHGAVITIERWIITYVCPVCGNQINKWEYLDMMHTPKQIYCFGCKAPKELYKKQLLFL